MAEKRLAPQERELYQGETRVVGIDCTGVLDAGETLTGSPTVDDPSGELTIADTQINGSQVHINAVPVLASRAVLFRVTRGSAPEGTYLVDLTISTSAGQTVTGTVTLLCV